ncbi:MAG: 50S ribosomal protein L11 methyltransferase [Bacteroidales bacterium]|nr:50S ribosomal protein L11 methyltransferase [Bacteroidales bacterium]
MKYNVVRIKLSRIEPFRDLLVYALGDEGDYDSFENRDGGLDAYVPTERFDEGALRAAIEENCEGCVVEYSVEELEDKDWNAEWERGHEAVLVDGFCWVRAPFHPHRDDVEYEIEIEPKMSFGTAHHATTYMMLTWLRDMDLAGRSVLDMGCGTAVLAILARKRGAGYVEAVDVDEWAWRNARENVERNGCGEIVCRLGDATTLGDERRFDVILANINRNILLNDMGAYVGVLKRGGRLVMSGFYESDIPMLQARGEGLGLRLESRRTRDNWASVVFSF